MLLARLKTIEKTVRMFHNVGREKIGVHNNNDNNIDQGYTIMQQQQSQEAIDCGNQDRM